MGCEILNKVFQEIDVYYSQKEVEIQTIDNAEDLLKFVTAMKETTEINATLRKYLSKNGSCIEGLNEAEHRELTDKILDRIKAYFAGENTKRDEIMEPYVVQIENLADSIAQSHKSTGLLQEGQFGEYIEIMGTISKYANLLTDEMNARFWKADKSVTKVLNSIIRQNKMSVKQNKQSNN